jgi:hypothetical protein
LRSLSTTSKITLAPNDVQMVFQEPRNIAVHNTLRYVVKETFLVFSFR